MRQAQQNRRGRGRSRKGQNPLTRTYESNGPDVKIRGTPSHIAEKYVSMARDALSSGDPVLAENYLQHAEHYNRIIMAHREQQMSDDGRAANAPGRGKGNPEAADDETGEDGESNAGERQPQAREQQARAPDSQPNGSASSASADEARPQRRGRHRGGDDSERGDGEGSSNGRANGRGGRRARYAENDDQPDFLKRPVRRRSSDEADSSSDVSVEADQAAE
jgi:hypothetical protein